MGTIISVVGGLSALLALLTAWPPTGGRIASMANAGRQARAFGRIRGLEGMGVDRVIRFDTADAGGGSATLGGEGALWRIKQFNNKRIVLTAWGEDVPYVVQLTPVEFEAGTAFLVE